MSLPAPARLVLVLSPATPAPSTPVSVVVRRTSPLRARASSRSMGAATARAPGVSVMYRLLSACAARWQAAVTARSAAVAVWQLASWEASVTGRGAGRPVDEEDVEVLVPRAARVS